MVHHGNTVSTPSAKSPRIPSAWHSPSRPDDESATRANKGQSSPFLNTIAIFLPGLAAFGPLVPAVGPFFGFRIAVLVFAASVYFRADVGSVSAMGKNVVSALIVWTLSGVVALTFAEDLTLAAKTLAALVIGGIFWLAFVRASQANRSLLIAFAWGWCLAFLVNAFIAVREFVTGNHLPGYLQGFDRERYALNNTLVAASFNNPNGYAVFLVSSVLFIIVVATNTEHKSIRALCVAMLVAAPILVAMTGSKICLIAILLQYAIFVGLDKGRRARWLIVLTSTVVAIAAISPRRAIDLMGALSFNLGQMSPSYIWGALGAGDETSGGQRVNLYLNGLWMLWKTGGIGVGPGNFESVMREGVAPLPTAGVLSPHSFFVEVLSEFGLAAFAAVCVLLLWTFYQTLEAPTGLHNWRAPLVAAFVGTFVAAFANSGYIISSSQWAFFAWLFAAVSGLQRERASLVENQGPGNNT